MGSVLPPQAPGIAGARPGVADGLLPYQRDGVEFLARRRVALLLDEMGLGKTPQAIRAADAIGAERLLIVGPAIARTNWARELARFGLLPRSVQVVGSGQERIDDAAEVVVTSYDLLNKPSILQQLHGRRFDVLIFDEAHALKNRTARRTRAVYGETCDGRGGLVERAQRVWLLTGTPMPNDVSEIWTHLRALLPEVITAGGRAPSYSAFLQRYCVVRPSQYGPRVVGNRNPGELRARLRPHVLRRRTADVLRDLPPIRWATVVLDPGVASADVRAAESSPEARALRAMLDAATANVGLADGGVADRDAAVERVLRADGIALSTLRRLTGIAKARATVQLLTEELTTGAIEKLVVFGHHVEVLRTLTAGLRRFGVVAVDGSTPARARQSAIDRFQNEPATRVFVAQVNAAATAITLTAAAHVLFAEASWVPADNLQAAKRCHRIGQRRPVLARFVSLAGSLDEAIIEVLRRKTRLLAQLLD